METGTWNSFTLLKFEKYCLYFVKKTKKKHGNPDIVMNLTSFVWHRPPGCLTHSCWSFDSSPLSSLKKENKKQIDFHSIVMANIYFTPVSEDNMRKLFVVFLFLFFPWIKPWNVWRPAHQNSARTTTDNWYTSIKPGLFLLPRLLLDKRTRTWRCDT